jgi:RNA polymerase sigma-70 factor (ECF subfamily)
MNDAPINDAPINDARAKVESIYRAQSRRVFATLVRLLGDLDLAEEALHDAFASALPDDSRPLMQCADGRGSMRRLGNWPSG